jgi:cyclase
MIEQVAPGLYIETRYVGGNVGAVVTDEGVVCVDAPMLPEEVLDWQAQIQSVASHPIVALIQTDYDQERVLGTSFFDVPLIAHDAIWDKMKVYSSEKFLNQVGEVWQGEEDAEDWHPRMPDITFSERLILYKGGRELHIIYGGGHSSATCMVHLPEESIIFAGDIVYCNRHPTMAQAETKQWLSVLNQLRKMSIELIIPGHGSCCDKESTQVLSEYIRDMRAVVRRNFQAGRSKSETSSAVITEFLDAFPYDENDRDQVRQLVKGGSDRIYDEYRTAAKADAARVRGALRKNKSRRPRRSG